MIQARAHALQVALSRAAAYLPAGRDLNEAHAARRELYDEDARRSHAGLSRTAGIENHFRRLQLRIYSDLLALGVTCRDTATEVRRLRRLLRASSP